MPSAASPSGSLVYGGSRTVVRAISAALRAFGEDALAFARGRGVRIVPLDAAQSYRDASASLRRLGVNVDAWPIPPAGLFGDVLRRG